MLVLVKIEVLCLWWIGLLAYSLHISLAHGNLLVILYWSFLVRIHSCVASLSIMMHIIT